MEIIATNLGERQTVQWKGKSVTTGIFKYPVQEPIFLEAEQVARDHICDWKHHGGIDQAVYAYSVQHYAYWKGLYPDLDWQYGMMGENLTLSVLDETSIRVGDRFQVGEVVLEATKPRIPCMKLGLRFSSMNILKQFWDTTMSGIYFKVVQTGYVQTGDVFCPLNTELDQPTISDVFVAKRAKKG